MDTMSVIRQFMQQLTLYICNIFAMPAVKEWTEREDQVLRFLFQEEKMTKWSKIAQRMAEEFKLPGRNGKQCRERYQNNLDPSFQHQEWTTQQQQRMDNLHNEIGNKWAQIAQHMPGRTDNCVKNHMYSKLRKAIRKLNKTITTYFKKEFKEIRPTVLYKIIEATDQNFKDNGLTKIGNFSREIKSEMFSFCNDEEIDKNCLPEIKELIIKVHEFSNMYKRKPKKQRRGHAQVKNLMKMPKIEKFKCSDVEDDSEDLEVSNEESIHIGEQDKEIMQIQQPFFAPKTAKIIEIKSSFRLHKEDSENEQRRKQLQESSLGYGVEQVLGRAGILQDAASMSIPQLMKHSISESNISERNEFHLGESIERNMLKYSIGMLRADGDIDEQNKLFKSIH